MKNLLFFLLFLFVVYDISAKEPVPNPDSLLTLFFSPTNNKSQKQGDDFLIAEESIFVDSVKVDVSYEKAVIYVLGTDCSICLHSFFSFLDAWKQSYHDWNLMVLANDTLIVKYYCKEYYPSEQIIYQESKQIGRFFDSGFLFRIENGRIVRRMTNPF